MWQGIDFGGRIYFNHLVKDFSPVFIESQRAWEGHFNYSVRVDCILWGKLSARVVLGMGGISKDVEINPSQMSSVCCIPKGLLFALTGCQLSEQVFVKHLQDPWDGTRCCGGHRTSGCTRSGESKFLDLPGASLNSVHCSFLGSLWKKKVKRRRIFHDMCKHMKCKFQHP